jgi:chromosome segregation ATPase
MTRLRIDRVTRHRPAGAEWTVEFSDGFNLIVGDRNTSKSTTLQIIDFCLGSDHTATRQFGSELADEYSAFELGVTINGESHVITRRLHAQGETTRTLVDGDVVDTSGFNQWIARELGWPWPPLMVPKGVLRSRASEETPLTFRTALRHIYRNASSWTTWADREFEYLRRAVTAHFLGVVEPVFGGAQVRATRLQLEREILEERRAELRDFLDGVIREVAEGFRDVGSTGIDSIESAVDEIALRTAELEAERVELVSRVRESPNFMTEDDQAIARLTNRLDDLLRESEELARMVAEQARLRQSIEGDLERFDRAAAAGRLIEHFQVTSCPVCFQPVDPSDGAADECYLCRQPLGVEVAERRVELERKTLRAERDELAAITSELNATLEHNRGQIAEMEDRRNDLLREIDRRRSSLVTPLLTRFEYLQRELGRLEQQQESLVRLGGLRRQMDRVDDRIRSTDEQLEQLRREAVEMSQERAFVRERCDVMAGAMNRFVDAMPGDQGLGGAITIDPNDMTFYVGSTEWRYALGDERRVLFFLAYHSGLLYIADRFETPFPALALLDNPFQQDVPISQVESALEHLANQVASAEAGQVIVASRRPLPQLDVARQTFTRQFNAAEWIVQS